MSDMLPSGNPLNDWNQPKDTIKNQDKYLSGLKNPQQPNITIQPNNRIPFQQGSINNPLMMRNESALGYDYLSINRNKSKNSKTESKDGKNAISIV